VAHLSLQFPFVFGMKHVFLLFLYAGDDVNEEVCTYLVFLSVISQSGENSYLSSTLPRDFTTAHFLLYTLQH
jgi:hypothetical protein